MLTCSLSAPCDLLAELVPCWQPVPSGPCQPLPGLQQPARGQVSGALWGAGDFVKDGGDSYGASLPLTGTPGVWRTAATPQPLRAGRTPLCPTAAPQAAPHHPHALLIHSLGQVWSGGQVRLTQCLRDREYCWGGRVGTACGSSCGGALLGLPSPPTHPPGTFPGALPGHPDDLLLLEQGENASLCAMERGACTPLVSFTSTVKREGPPCPGSSGTGDTGTPVPGSGGTAV